MPVTLPETSDVNLTPTSTPPAVPESAFVGVTALPQMEQVQPTLIERPVEGVSTLPLSSTARVLMVVVGLPCATQLYDQLVVPVAGCHVVPPSVDTSTPATTPPVSAAVPLTVILVPSATFVPAAGEVMLDVGAVESVDLVAAVTPAIGAYGWAPMSAKRFTVACCMATSMSVPVGSSRPQAH